MASVEEIELYKTCDELVAALESYAELSDGELEAVTKRAKATMAAWDVEIKDLDEDVEKSYPKKGRAAAQPKTRAAAAAVEAAAPAEAAAPEETAGPSRATAVEETAAPTEVAAADEPAVETAPAPRERRQTTVPKNLQIDMKVDESVGALGRGQRARKPKKMFGGDVAEPLVTAVKGKRKRATAANGEDEAVIAPRPQKRFASAAAVAAASVAAAAAAPPPPPPAPPAAPPARKIRAAVSPAAVSQRMTRAASRASAAASRAVSVVSAAPAKKRGRPRKEDAEVEVAAPPAKKARKGKEREMSVSEPAASSAAAKKGKAPAKPKVARSRRPAAKKGKGKERVEEEEALVEEGARGEEEGERLVEEEQRVGSQAPTIKREHSWTTAEINELYD